MAFIDELTIYAQAGKGGDGVVRWLRQRFRPFGGPSGGNGGKGGDVYVEGVRDIGILSKLKYKKEFIAESGTAGSGNSKHGKDGKDLTIHLPVGSIIKNIDTNKVIELLKEDKRLLILKGGHGGLGNEHFKSSTNQQPKESTKGKKGESGTFFIELQLVADAGFVGLPNAGKSSLINAVTKANAKVGDYSFTTLDPNLGAFYGFILADMPGLIKGASEGKGLGYKFLRHTKRTRLILHCISLERDNIYDTYVSIRSELNAFGSLEDKKEVIILTKSDLVTSEVYEKVRKEMEEKTGNAVIVTSSKDESSVREFSKKLTKILNS